MDITCNKDRHLRILELDKILELLAAECSCSDAADRARELMPVTEVEAVRHLLQETWDAHGLIGRYGTPNFGGVRSVANPLRRAQAGGGLSMRELLRVAEVLRIIRSLREWRGKCEGETTCFDALFMALIPNKFLEEKINGAIVNEDELSDNASSELATIRRKMRAAQSRVRDQLDKIIRSPSYQKYLQDPIVTIRSGRFVVPVKAECRASVPGLVHDASSSGATVFVEPMAVVEANNEIKVLESKEAAEIERILLELSAEAGLHADTICTSYEMLMQIDLIFAKARLAYNMKAALPAVNDEGVIRLNKARHPLIDKDKVVATNIRLGGSFDTLMITGPNTGGKTVTLKTLGLMTVMAECGLLIPVSDESTISVFDRVLADIGDEQSIEQSLSTFSGHMKNIVSIIELADERSLVLLDELGAGTDPVEGAALAMSIIERLRSSGARIAVTTHYAELKSYALSTPGVENGSCEFDVATLRPTYRLLIGVPGRSNAFAIGERLGIPQDVVDRARALVSEDSTKFEQVVESLEISRQKLEQSLAEAEQERLAARRAREAAEKQKNTVERERERMIESARTEASRIVSQTRWQVNALLGEMEQLRREMSSANAAELERRAKSELRSKMRQIEDTADPVIAREDDDDYVLPRPLREGDIVLMKDIDKKGTVIKVSPGSDTVEVQAGLIKTRVKVSSLRLVEEKGVTVNSKAPAQRRTSEKQISASVPTEIDVRGLTVDEAIIEVDKVIDSAVLRSLGEIRVIHGKGTGALRSGLHAHFKRHSSIRSFRLGVYGEGETGVTIIEIK